MSLFDPVYDVPNHRHCTGCSIVLRIGNTQAYSGKDGLCDACWEITEVKK